MPTYPHASPAKRFLMLHVVPALVLCLIRLLKSTWRIQETGRDYLDRSISSPNPAIMAFFHGRTFPLMSHMTGKSNGKWVSMCSKSLDGEAMARVEEKLGIEVVRGSSGRDGLEAIQEMIRRVRSSSEHGACLAVDGSRGPRGHVQGGIIRMARWTGGSIVPITAAAKSAWIFQRAWDRTLLPRPFAKVVIAYGEPIEVPKKLDAARTEAIRSLIEKRLLHLQREADLLAGATDSEPMQAAIPSVEIEKAYSRT